MELTIKSVFDTVKSILPGNGFNKIGDRTAEMLEAAEEETRGVVIPTLESLLEHKEVLKSLDNKPSTKVLKEGLKVRSMEEYVKKSLEHYRDTIKNVSKIEKEVKTNVSNTTNEKTMTFKQLSLVRYVEDMLSNNRFTMRSLYMAMRDDKDSVLPVKFTKDIIAGIPGFRTKVLNGHGVKQDLADIDDLPDDAVYTRYGGDVPESIALDGVANKTIFTGFIGNPIYTFRKWWIDRQIDKRDGLVDAKNMVELRLMELRNLESGNEDNEQLKKQIVYYEEKLASMDAKIARLESVD